MVFHLTSSPCNRNHLGYVYTGSDMFRSVLDRLHCGTDPLCLHGTGSKLERYGSISDHLHKWTHLVPDSRSEPYRIHQVPCKHKVYTYQFRIGSKRIRSRVNAALQNMFVTMFQWGSKAVNISIANISCERSIITISA